MQAIFFRKYGFTIERWNEFADALRKHAQTANVVDFQETSYGDRYVLEGNLAMPAGLVAHVRSIWMIPLGETNPHLVTAYPKGE